MRDRVAASFRDWTDELPELMVRAPGRVNLIGDHTDYNDGFVLPAAIDQATWLAATIRSDRQVRVTSLEEGSIEIDLDAVRPTGGWADYVAGVIWALEEPIDTGFNMLIGTEIPVGAGLSSSAALEIGTARVLAELFDRSWDPVGAAIAGQRAENDFVGMPCGIMDQLIVATAHRGAASLIDCRTLQTTPAPLGADAMIVILDTGTRRRLVDSAYQERRAACERVAGALGIAALRDATPSMVDQADVDPTDRRRATHVVAENARTTSMAGALALGDAAAAGSLMDQSHASLRDLYEVSAPALDAIVAIAQANPSCWGARMTGAGFAGCGVALVRPDGVGDFVADVKQRYLAEIGRTAVLYPTEAAPGVSIA